MDINGGPDFSQKESKQKQTNDLITSMFRHSLLFSIAGKKEMLHHAAYLMKFKNPLLP